MAFKQIWQQWRLSSALKRLIVVNVVVWIFVRIAEIVLSISGAPSPQTSVSGLVEMPSNPVALITVPWTIVTYMFAQYDFMHILFNMLWLYWFGLIFLALSTGRKLVSLYFIGGLAGALLYLLAYNLIPYFAGINGMLIGSSASVIAIVTATAMMAPGYRMNLMLIGPVALKWVAIVTIAIDLLSVTGSNAGGHIAHLGGAIAGAAYVLALRHGVDITAPFDSVARLFAGLSVRRKVSSVFSRSRAPLHKHTEGPKRKESFTRDDRENLDAILDKIKQSGYTSLTAEERRKLFDVSRKIK